MITEWEEFYKATQYNLDEPSAWHYRSNLIRFGRVDTDLQAYYLKQIDNQLYLYERTPVEKEKALLEHQNPQQSSAHVLDGLFYMSLMVDAIRINHTALIGWGRDFNFMPLNRTIENVSVYAAYHLKRFSRQMMETYRCGNVPFGCLLSCVQRMPKTGKTPTFKEFENCDFDSFQPKMDEKAYYAPEKIKFLLKTAEIAGMPLKPQEVAQVYHLVIARGEKAPFAAELIQTLGEYIIQRAPLNQAMKMLNPQTENMSDWVYAPLDKLQRQLSAKRYMMEWIKPHGY